MTNTKNAYLERLAVVVSKNEANNTVVCEYGVNGLCGSCSEKTDDCAPEIFSSEQKTMVFTLKNTCNAELRQIVRVGVPAKSLLLSSFISYAVPLFFMIACAGLTFSFTSENARADVFASLGAVAGLGFGFSVSMILAKILKRTIWNPRMLGVLPVKPECKNTTKVKN